MVILVMCSSLFAVTDKMTNGEMQRMFLHVSEESLQIDRELKSDKQELIRSIKILEEVTVISDDSTSIEVRKFMDKPAVDIHTLLNADSRWSFDYNGDIFIVKHYGNVINLGITSDGRIGVYGSGGITDYIPEPEPLLINGHLFTFRGLNWSNTLNLIFERPFIGYGADTLAIYQRDAANVIDNINYAHHSGSRALNPHNMYLQIWYNFGIFGLIGFLGFVLMIFIFGFIQFFKEEESREVLTMTMYPVAAFLIAGMLNDTIVGTGVILYLLLGLAAVAVFKPLELEK